MTHARSRLFSLAAVAAASLLPLQAAHAQAEPFLGQIMCGGFNFAPRGWARLDGQLMPIAQNTALFSLLGTTYGGDGRSTFALPDMRGRALLHDGQGPGLSPHIEGTPRAMRL
jgi:microcystin-dependent protein